MTKQPSSTNILRGKDLVKILHMKKNSLLRLFKSITTFFKQIVFSKQHIIFERWHGILGTTELQRSRVHFCQILGNLLYKIIWQPILKRTIVAQLGDGVRLGQVWEPQAGLGKAILYQFGKVSLGKDYFSTVKLLVLS